MLVTWLSVVPPTAVTNREAAGNSTPYPLSPELTVTAMPGWPSRAELVERYAAATGRDVSRIAYYEIFAIFKVAVVLQQIYHRYHLGQTRDERFASMEGRVLGLVEVATELMAGCPS